MIYENVMQAVFPFPSQPVPGPGPSERKRGGLPCKKYRKTGRAPDPRRPGGGAVPSRRHGPGKENRILADRRKKRPPRGRSGSILTPRPQPDGVGMAHRRRGASLLSQAGPCKAGGPLWGLPVRSGLFLRRLSLVHGGKGRDPGYGRYGPCSRTRPRSGDPSPGGPCAGRKGWIRSGRSFL